MTLSAWATLAPTTRLLVAVVVGFAAAWGGAMELLQGTVPHRSASWEDAVLNTAGAAIAVTTLIYARRAVERRLRVPMVDSPTTPRPIPTTEDTPR